MRTAWPRRTALLGGALGTLALGGCTDKDPEPGEDPWDDLGLTPRVVPSSHAPRLQQLPGDDLGELEAPEGTFRLSATLLTGKLTPDQAEKMVPHRGEGPADDITAAEGQVFLLATLARTPTLWPFVSDDLRFASSMRVFARRPDGEGYEAAPITAAEAEQTLLMQVPEHPAPDDALLEIAIAGRTQRLSLIDGSVQESEVAYLNRRSTSVQDAATGQRTYPAEAISERQEDADGNQDSFLLTVRDAQLTPMTPRLGWPDPGMQLLGIVLQPYQTFRRPGGEPVQLPVRPAKCRLTTPDQKTTEPRDVQLFSRDITNGTFRSAIYILWFPVATDIEAARVEMSLEAAPRSAELRKHPRIGRARLELEFTSEPVVS